MKKFFLLFSTFFILSYTYSQRIGTIKGYIYDTEKPINFVNISLLNVSDSSLVVGVVSNDSGFFEMSKISDGNYLISINHIAYLTKYVQVKIDSNFNNIVLEKIILEINSKELNEITVKGIKPVFEKKNDRLVVNIEGSTLSSLRSNGADLIRNLPGIWFDRQNNISFNGQKNVQITINGRSRYLSTNDLMTFLRSLPVNSIEEIEIISNPNATYGAEGSAIINIKTKTNIDSGFNGSINSLAGTSVGYGAFYPRLTNGLNLSLGKKKLSIFGNYSFASEESLRKINELLTFPTSTLNQSINIENLPEKTHNLQSGLDFMLTKNQTIKFFYNKVYNNTLVNQLNNITVIVQKQNNSNTSSSANEKLISDQDELNFEYQNLIDSTKKITLGTDYILFDKGHTANYYNIYDNNRAENLKNNSSTNIGVWVGKFDFKYDFKSNNSIETGIKYSYVNTKNDVKFEELINDKWTSDIIRSNTFAYKEKTFASYINFTSKIKKVDIVAGIRYETSMMSGSSQTNQFIFEREFSGFFPSVSFNYTLNPNTDLGLFYSKRVKRPGYVDINPFIYYVNPFTILEGNPLLIPSITNKIQLNINYKKMYSASISYYFTKEIFTTAQFQNIDNRTQRLVPTNIGDLANIELNFGIPISPYPWWEGYFDITLYNQKYAEKAFAGLGFQTNARTTFQFYTQQTFTLPADIGLEFTSTFVTPSVDGQFSFSNIYTFSLGIKKSFLNKKIDVKLGFLDFLKTLKYDGKLGGVDWNSNFQDLKDSRQFNISINYNFYKKGKVKSAKANWVSEEEKKRIK